MQLVHSKDDIEKIRPYKEQHKLIKFPNRYPAFVEFDERGGGIVGDYYVMEILEIPENVDVESFIIGVQAKPKEYYENDFIRKK